MEWTVWAQILVRCPHGRMDGPQTAVSVRGGLVWSIPGFMDFFSSKTKLIDLDNASSTRDMEWNTCDYHTRIQWLHLILPRGKKSKHNIQQRMNLFKFLLRPRTQIQVLTVSIFTSRVTHLEITQKSCIPYSTLLGLRLNLSNQLLPKIR